MRSSFDRLQGERSIVDYIVRIIESYMEMCEIVVAQAMYEYDMDLAQWAEERWAKASDALDLRLAQLARRA